MTIESLAGRVFKLGICGSALLLVLSDAKLGVGVLSSPSLAQNSSERTRVALENIAGRLHGRDLPDGVVKANGLLEATQVDVVAKYSGRLAHTSVFITFMKLREKSRSSA